MASRRKFLGNLLGFAGLVAVNPEVLAVPPTPPPEKPKQDPILTPYIDIAQLYNQPTPIRLSDPESVEALGGKNNPIHLYWNDTVGAKRLGQFICAEDIIIDNQKGELRIREDDQSERVLMIWPSSKTRREREPNNPRDNWLRDETGPHILLAKQLDGIAPEAAHYTPISVPALREHPLHYRNVYLLSKEAAKYRSENIDERGTRVKDIKNLEAILPAPSAGRYHEITPPPHVNKNSAEWVLWCDDTAHKMAYNILHFNPHTAGYKKEHNISLLALAMTESAGGGVGDKLGPNPFLINYAGYGGLFQFYVGNKASKREALKDAGFVGPSGQWQDNEIHGKKLTMQMRSFFTGRHNATLNSNG